MNSCPLNPHEIEYDFGRREGRSDVDSEAHGSADYRGIEASGRRANGGRGGPRAGHQLAHDLRLEGEVWGPGGQRGPPSAATGRREPAIEEAGGGSEPGQRHAADGDPKKRLELTGIRAEVGYLRSTLGPSERRVYELREIAVSSYRYPSQRQDDGELREKLVPLAGEMPRFGYQRLHVLLR
jgi:hypothetical protein